MLSSIRRSFGISPSASASSIHTEYFEPSDAPVRVLSPSNKPNTLIPLRRSSSFTSFFSSSRSSSPVKDQHSSSASKIMSSPTRASSSNPQPQADAEPVLAFLVLMDKKGRQKQRYPIQSIKTTMGRSIENDVRFLVNDVSRLHCTIEIEIQQAHDSHDTKAFLQVIGANGVLLNGTHAYPAPRGAGRYELHTNDSIVIAKRSFIFELPTPTSGAPAVPTIYASPVKGAAPGGVPQTPLTTSKRRIRMSLVNSAQIDTPAKQRKQSSPSKFNDAEREARRANGLQRFMQSANVSPSKAKKSSRQSLASSSGANLFATPVKSRESAVEPKTAPPKQVSFSLYANSYSGRLSPVKQMRMMPPLDTMNEEHDASFSNNSNEQLPQEPVAEVKSEQEEEADSPLDESSEDIVIVEELEQESEQVAEPEAVLVTNQANPAKMIAEGEDKENTYPSTPVASSPSAGSPSKSGSPKRAKRRSSFFGRAGPFAGISLGFYAEERKEEPAEEAAAPQSAEDADEFSDASDTEPAPMDKDQPVQASPIQCRIPARSMTLGISKTPSPIKKQHFVGLTPMPRRPRLSLNNRRNVSLRTQTLLRSSEAYADRLFLPPPPPSPATPGTSSLSQSMSMPSNLSAMAPMQPPSAFNGPSLLEAEQEDQVQEQDDFEANLDPALSEEEHEEWKDSEDDEDEVDQSLSVLSPSPRKAPYNFSPVKTVSLPQFATPQPASRLQSRRISMPPAGATDAKPSLRTALVRLQISGAGERIVHETSKKTEPVQVRQSSPTKSRRVVRVSDVGLPATELSMGFDLVQDSAEEPESEKIAEALNDLFTAEDEELTDDEMIEDDKEEIVQISSKVAESPSRPSTSTLPPPMQVPQTPAALSSVRHLFSSASAQPSTPDMQGLAAMLNSSPEKQPQYGNLGDRMRAANPEIVDFLSPSKRSPRKVASGSPIKTRKGVRRSEAAELAVPLPAIPRAAPSVPTLTTPAVTPLPPTLMMPPSVGGTPVRIAVEAELHVTMFDAGEMDAQNEAIARALAEAVEAEVEPVEATTEEQLLEGPGQVVMEEESIVDQVIEEPATESATEEAVAEPVESVQEMVQEAAAETAESVQEAEAEAESTPVEPSPTKRTSRRAASASPTKRTARSVSPSKRTTRSSPVKRSSAAVLHAPELFHEEPLAEPVPEEIAEELSPEVAEPKSPTKPKSRSSPTKRAPARDAAEKITVEEPAAQEEEGAAKAEQEVSVPEPESPTKHARRAGGRKAKTIAAEAIGSASFTSSPEKPVRKARAASAKKTEEQPPAEEQSAAEEEEAPKKATRSRTTRTAAAATRTTRTRATKTVEPAVPSSSAGYGDDEASEVDEAAPVKAKKGAKGKKAEESESPTKPVAKATRKPAARAARTARAKVVETSEVEEASGQEEAEEVPAKPTRARATRTTAAKKTKAKADAEEVVTSSSATTASTTRSGRPRRAAAAK